MKPPLIRDLGLTDYLPVWRDMQSFTASRGEDTPDVARVCQTRVIVS